MEAFFSFVQTKMLFVWKLVLNECVCRRPPSNSLLMLWRKLRLLISVGYLSFSLPISATCLSNFMSMRSNCWPWLVFHPHDWLYLQVPPLGKGSLYIRPLLIGTGPVLGLAPAPEYTFLIYASPVRNYFKVGTCSVELISLLIKNTWFIYILLVFFKQEGSAPLNLYVENEFVRASRGGTGGVKTISNYAPVCVYYIFFFFVKTNE